MDWREALFSGRTIGLNRKEGKHGVKPQNVHPLRGNVIHVFCHFLPVHESDQECRLLRPALLPNHVDIVNTGTEDEGSHKSDAGLECHH